MIIITRALAFVVKNAMLIMQEYVNYTSCHFNIINLQKTNITNISKMHKSKTIKYNGKFCVRKLK